MAKKPKPNVVVLGGGNGTSRLLMALKPLLDEKEIGSLHALVLNADDGGSTGRLRSQYGVGAMGDLTRCLMALSDFRGDVRGEQLLRALEHRFSGGDFAGHTLRNIFLAALEITAKNVPVKSPNGDHGAGPLDSGEIQDESSLDSAIAMMARVLQVPKYAGVVPTTLTPLTQQVVISFDNKPSLLGEGQHFISHNVNLQADPRWKPGDVRVQFAEGDVALNPRAAEVLQEATHVIIAPGHTYGTILPTLALPLLSAVLAKSKAKIVVVMTLLTTPRQTTDWSGEDFVRVYESYLGRNADVVIANTGAADVGLVSGQDWVRFTESEHTYQLLAEDIVSLEKQIQAGHDAVPRGVVIHSPDKMRAVLRGILNG